jgi:hypothetical protein
MNPPDIDLFPKPKQPLCNQQPQSLEKTNTAMTQCIRHLNSSGKLNGIQKLPEHWELS